MTNVGTPSEMQVMHAFISQTASGVIVMAIGFLARKAWAWVSNNLISREVESS